MRPLTIWGASGAARLEEITATNGGLQQVLVALNSIDERTREMLTALVVCIVDTSMEAVRKSAQDTLFAWRKGTREAAKIVVRKVLKAGSVALRKSDIKIVFLARQTAEQQGLGSGRACGLESSSI